jgi:hypothetical protein
MNTKAIVRPHIHILLYAFIIKLLKVIQYLLFVLYYYVVPTCCFGALYCDILINLNLITGGNYI